MRTQHRSIAESPQLVRTLPYLLHERISPLSVHQRCREEVSPSHIRRDESEGIFIRGNFISRQRIISIHRWRKLSGWLHVLWRGGGELSQWVNKYLLSYSLTLFIIPRF